jgi:hypothetical protein
MHTRFGGQCTRKKITLIQCCIGVVTASGLALHAGEFEEAAHSRAHSHSARCDRPRRSDAPRDTVPERCRHTMQVLTFLLPLVFIARICSARATLANNWTCSPWERTGQVFVRSSLANHPLLFSCFYHLAVLVFNKSACAIWISTS